MGKNSAVVNKSIDSLYINTQLKEKHYTHRISREALEILKNSNSLNKGAGFNLGNLETTEHSVNTEKKEQRAFEKSCKAKTKSSLTVQHRLSHLSASLRKSL